MANAFLNNTDEDVHLFMFKEGSRFTHASTSSRPIRWRRRRADGLRKLWKDPPQRKLGPHDGLTDLKRRRPSPQGSRKARKPDFVAHWRDILEKKAAHYPGSDRRAGHRRDASASARDSRASASIWKSSSPDGARPIRMPSATRKSSSMSCPAKIDCWLDGHISPDGRGRLRRLGSRHRHHPCDHEQQRRGRDPAGRRRSIALRTASAGIPIIRRATRRWVRTTGPIIRCRSSARMTDCPMRCASACRPRRASPHSPRIPQR